MSRNQAYDAGDSRRSPRSRSPRSPRYNNDFRDEYRDRGNLSRGGERRRSISDSRPGSFPSNRDNTREPMGRGSRDFPPREPPRGPKALIDAPAGPRATNYGGDFRGDFGYRGDFGRGGRGRGGRGRGSWRDDSRDRGRESERDYRGPRDDRGPPPFRDDRSRDRDRWDRNDNFRGRRASSPQGRGRSPVYGSREIRDAPSSLDVDRARRDSRDGPLSGGSPSSDSLQPYRGYGRGRGSRGRGRGTYYDDHYGRNPSPDTSWGRRTQPSATPPPQVPAFGSTSTNLPAPPSAPRNSVASVQAPTGPAVDPLPGISVPTAPRSHTSVSRPTVGRSKDMVNSKKWTNSDRALLQPSTSHSVATIPSTMSPANDSSLSPAVALPQSVSNEVKSPAEKSPEATSTGTVHPSTTSAAVSNISDSNRKRKPAILKHAVRIITKSSPQVDDNASVDSDADSSDSMNIGEVFENEMKSIEEQVSRLPVNPADDPLDFSKLATLSGLPVPAEDDAEQRERWQEELEYQKSLLKKKYEKGLLDVNPLGYAAELDTPFIEPYKATKIDHQMLGVHSTMLQITEDSLFPECKPESQQDVTSAAANQEEPSTSGAQSKERSHPHTPLVEPSNGVKPVIDDDNKPKDNEEGQAVLLETSQVVMPALESNNVSSSKASHATKPSGDSLPIPNGKPAKPKLSMEMPDGSDDDETPEERIEQLQSVRKMMKTPPISGLPKFNCKKWDEDEEFIKTLESDPEVDVFILNKLRETESQKEKEQEEEGRAWAARYLAYRKWTDLSNDPACVRSREKFAKAKANEAAEAAALKMSTPAPSSRPETSRRTGRFATEHDFERVLRESEQEAIEAKEKEERSTRARTASAKEATIPNMCWDEEEWQQNSYADTTGLVPFERSFAILEFGEPIDNFTPEENEAFEKAYIEFPKQWGKIAEALPNRDYKACIQHYYLVKHKTGLKEKSKKKVNRRKKAAPPKGAKPKTNASITEVNRDDGEDGDEIENSGNSRRPRRAAAPRFPIPEPAQADSEGASPAPTPGRKNAATPKVENGTETPAPAPKVRKPRAPREKVSKQAKNSQLLAAAPAPVSRRPESPINPPQPAHSGSMTTSRLATPYDGAAALTSSFATSPYLAVDRNAAAPGPSFEAMSQTFPGQERDSTTPMSFDAQDRRNPSQHTSSYWSVPEQSDFPDLLRHFGTDWHGIAKHMASKTHIMVYHTVFEDWLVVPADSNRSRCVANIQTQVKNYYQRHAENGKMAAWENIAREADEKRRKGESTGPPPIPTVIPKTRSHPNSGGGMGSVSDGLDEMASSGQNLTMQQGSPTQAPVGSRFPTLAQAGPAQQTLSQPATPTSLITKHLPTQSSAQHAPQQPQPQSRQSRGPSLGYFNTDPQRPVIQAANSGDSTVSQRSLKVAQEAQIERQQALRIQEREREQAQAQAQAQHQVMQQHQMQQQNQSAMLQQQQAIQRDLHRERQHQMKQEADVPNLHQFEPYSTPPTHANAATHSRPDAPVAAPPDFRRTISSQQYQPRSHQAVRNLHGDNGSAPREVISTPSPSIHRGPMSAPPASQEQFPAPHQPPHQSHQSHQSISSAAPPRAPEPVSRRSNIMSLLNDPEPSEPIRPTPPKRVSDIATTTIQPSRTPPPQHAMQPSRYASQQPLPAQPSQQLPPQMAAHPGQQHQHQSQPPHSYGQQPQHSIHQGSTAAGLSRSYTPGGFESRGYAPPPNIPQQQAPTPIYSQPPRQPVTAQPPPNRRDTSHAEHHSLAGGYSRSSIPTQSSSRLKESPYSASPTPPNPQISRQQLASPLDIPPAVERDYYSRQQQFHMQQQTNPAGSPQLGPSYHPQAQQAPPNHRHLAFGQTPGHVASPPTQYAAQHSLHRSRHNSFDSGHRYSNSGGSAPPQSQQGYTPAPQHQAPQHQAPHTGSTVPMPYQPPAAHDRFDSRFDHDRRMREDRMREEEYHQRQRALEDSRRR